MTTINHSLPFPSSTLIDALSATFEIDHSGAVHVIDTRNTRTSYPPVQALTGACDGDWRRLSSREMSARVHLMGEMFDIPKADVAVAIALTDMSLSIPAAVRRALQAVWKQP